MYFILGVFSVAINKDSFLENNNNILNLDNSENNSLFSADFCAAMDNANISMYIIDPETYQVLYCNKTISKVLGADRSGAPCYKTMSGLDEPCQDCPAVRLYRNGNNAPAEIYNKILNIWVLVNASVLHWKGRDLIQVTCVNITKQKQMERELRMVNKEYEALLNQCLSGVIRYDITTDTAIIKTNDLLNKFKEQVVHNYSKVACEREIIVPSSIELAQKGLENIRNGVPSNNGYDLQFTLDGETIRWCHIDYLSIFDDDGKPNRAIISLADVTERKNKEIAYEEWNSRLNAIVGRYAAFMEFNLTKDIIDAQGSHGLPVSFESELRFSDYIAERVRTFIYAEDAEIYRKFFDRNRLIKKFYAGQLNCSMKYRIVIDGKPQWYSAELHMISKPSDSDIKGFVLFNNIDSDIQEKEQLTREAQRDIMTGLYNHATTEQLIKQVFDQNTGERCCFLMIDLDDLRDINSTLGHPEGDRTLKAIAEAMHMQFGKQNILGRIGGDEFVVLLRDAPDPYKLQSSVSEFLHRLNRICIGSLNDTPIRVSIGGAMGIVGEDDFKSLYEKADLALYYTKAMGKNDFNLYVPELERRDFNYRPISHMTITRPDWYDDAEFKKLLKAMSIFCPLVISANLTKNSYQMLEYMHYATHGADDRGCYDYLIDFGATRFHPEDRLSFKQALNRQQLLKDYYNGKQMSMHVGRQLGDDGVYRLAHTIAVFMKDEDNGDICEISFTHLRELDEM